MTAPDPPRPADPGDGGAVLVFVVLLMLALVGLAHGLLVAALGELAASTAGVRHLRARAAAEAAVGRALRSPPDTWVDSLTVGESRPTDTVSLAGATGVATLRRLSRESWLVVGRGGPPGGPTVRSARLAWSLDPLQRVVALPAVVNGGSGASWELSGSIDASAPTRIDAPLDSVDCAPWLPELEAHYAAAPLAATGSLTDTVGGPGLGPLAFGLLLRAAPLGVSGAGTPEPVERLGACVEDEPWAWGDPDRPSDPCGTHLPLRSSVGDLTVVGGAGQGVLVVDGDLTLTAGARYYGLLIARGSVRLDGGAAAEGLVMAGAGVEVGAGARVRGAACWAVRALSANHDALGRLLLPERVGRLGPI